MAICPKCNERPVRDYDCYCGPCRNEYKKEWRRRRIGFGRRRQNGYARTPKATVSPTIIDLSWAAGFLEGEGCFYRSHYIDVQGVRKVKSHAVRANQVNEIPLQRLQALFGGALVKKPNRNGMSNWNHIWWWAAHGTRARGIMMTLYQFLSPIRQAQVRYGLGLTDIRGTNPPTQGGDSDC